MNAEGPFTTRQIAEALDIHPRKVVTLEERGLVEPSVRRASGTGREPRLWSYEDVVDCALVQHLSLMLVPDFLRIVLCELRKVKDAMCEDKFYFVLPPVGTIRSKASARFKLEAGAIWGNLLYQSPPKTNRDAFEVWRTQMEATVLSRHPVYLSLDFGILHGYVTDRLRGVGK